ncbi:MAG TPA: fructosamine kinase family protein [Prolixibacteraceae bacterium]|jgi:fructosamine-3-kinase
MVEGMEHAVIHLCIEKLAELHGSSVRLLNSHPLGGGCINHALKIQTSAGDYFLKWNAASPVGLFIREAEGMEEMSTFDNRYLQFPKVIWSKEVDQWPGLLLMEYLPPASTTTGFDERLGRGIARLHHKTAADYGFHHSNYCGTTLQDNTWTDTWPGFYAHRRIQPLVEQIIVTRGMAPGEQKIYQRLVNKLPQLLAHPSIPSLIHGDLWSGNYMYTSKGPALIDPACYYADREMELGMMKLFGGFSPSVWNAYQDEFPLPVDWKQRIPLYQLYHLLNHYLLFGGSYGWQSLEIAKGYL